MELSYSPEEVAFKAEVEAFLTPYRDVGQFFHHDDAGMRPLFQKMGERNWLALSWPREVGGEGLPMTYEFILWDEMAHHRIARPPMSAGIVAESIIRHGSEAQKQRWLEPIRRGDLHFALGYSEPEAGSDLANVSCRAERHGDVYFINGSKCWNTQAHTADCIWLLCRTGPPGSRGGGLSLFIVDRRSLGVTVRPMDVMGGHVFTTVDFDGAEVPAENWIGPENGAWALMSSSLADERVVQFAPKRVRRDLEEAAAFVDSAGIAHDPGISAAMGELTLEALRCQAQSWGVMSAVMNGQPGAIEAAVNKLTYTQAAQTIARATMALGGPAALVSGSDIETQWQASMIESIGGGTSEIMTSIIARRALGLGRGPEPAVE